MPEENRYACSKSCIENYNAQQLELHKQVIAEYAEDDEPPPEPVPVPLRRRPDSDIEPELVLPGMKVTRHHVREGDGSRGFPPGYC